MFKHRLFFLTLIVAIVVVGIVQTEASPEEKKAESYIEGNLKSYHPKKIEIKLKYKEPEKKESGGGGE